MNAHPAPPYAPPPAGGHTRPGHWILLVLGVLLSVLGAGLAVGGAVALGADAAQRDGRYLTGPTERRQSTGYALTSSSVVIDPGSAGLPSAPAIEDLAGVRVRATPVVPDQEVFIGLAEAPRVAAYLDGVPHASLGEVSWAGPWPGRPARDGRTSGRRRPPAPAPRRSPSTCSRAPGPWW